MLVWFIPRSVGGGPAGPKQSMLANGSPSFFEVCVMLGGGCRPNHFSSGACYVVAGHLSPKHPKALWPSHVFVTALLRLLTGQPCVTRQSLVRMDPEGVLAGRTWNQGLFGRRTGNLQIPKDIHHPIEL